MPSHDADEYERAITQAFDAIGVTLADRRRLERHQAYWFRCATATMRRIFENVAEAADGLRPAGAPDEPTTLDDWLAAVHRGEFPELDPPGQGRDRNGYDLFRADPVTLKRFFAQRDRIHRTWPRLCTSCGLEFRPDRRNIRRCPTCRAAHA